jgi:hypothetical protein
MRNTGSRLPCLTYAQTDEDDKEVQPCVYHLQQPRTKRSDLEEIKAGVLERQLHLCLAIRTTPCLPEWIRRANVATSWQQRSPTAPCPPITKKQSEAGLGCAGVGVALLFVLQ